MSIKMPKPSKTKELTPDFKNLVLNGIEFLEKAMKQLKTDPKHSVINFYTAVEIFLKAPLVHEHWSLVVIDRNPNRKNYEAGDFISVTFEDTCTRLSNSLSTPLPKTAQEAFNKVRKHRNRIVHFYHRGIDGQQRDAIKLEQAQAWFELNRFVTDTWSELFKPFKSEFLRMEKNLIANNHYAQAKYYNLKPKIEGMKKGGVNFEDCPRCGTNACQIEEEAKCLTLHNCLVCFYSNKQIQTNCPGCDDSDQYITPYNGFICQRCDYKITNNSQLFSLLDQSTVRGTKHDFESNTPANCDECQSNHSVCEYEEKYLCINCLTYFDSINQCEWCNEPMTGDPEDTYVFGCEYCDGYAGHHAND